MANNVRGHLEICKSRG